VSGERPSEENGMATQPHTRIDPDTLIGPVALRVGDLDRMRSFYRDSIGLTEIAPDDRRAVMGAGRLPIVELISAPDAPMRPRGTTGLFHLAVLMTDRAELARSIRRVAASGWRFSGASDHLVSEALYLDDPEGNGIEIYRDRPREDWRRSPRGELEMDTLPLDLESILEEISAEEDSPGPAGEGTSIGHVHLNVAEIEEAGEFYAGVLGFDVMVRSYPGALFLSAGGYHHHLGLNTWGISSGPPPEGSRGLAHYTIEVASDRERDRLHDALQAARSPVTETDSGLETRDPSGNNIRITTR
jgi:catechol 2,3-dioxygenase